MKVLSCRAVTPWQPQNKQKERVNMNAGKVFTERYLKLMFKSLRDATPEEVDAELEHCRRENRRPVKTPRYFRGFFTEEEKYHASTGFEMQVFSHNESSQRKARSLSLSNGRNAGSSSTSTAVPSFTLPCSSIGVSCTTFVCARIAMPCCLFIPNHRNMFASIQ